MKKGCFFLILAVLLLCGCEKKPVETEQTEMTLETTEVTVPATIPADGDPEDVTCKGSYTGQGKQQQIVAMAGIAELTNEELAVWYWAEVAQYRQENHEISPDFEKPLDIQACEIDSSVRSWQQYFLKGALSAWHNAQALIQRSEEVPLVFEEAYQPNKANIEKYMTGMPASEVLYGYHTYYHPNSMHQAYLDAIPQILEDLALEKGYSDAQTMAQNAFGTSLKALETFALVCNRGYMYFTDQSYSIEPTAEELEAFYLSRESQGTDGISVDFRQILLIPKDSETERVDIAADGKVACTEAAWSACETEAREILLEWQEETFGNEATFGELAHKYTKDPGTVVNGGRYQNVQKGQMTGVIDAWCFDPARQAGDTAILRSDYGVHILHFSGSQSLDRAQAEQEYYRQQQNMLISNARDAFPMEVSYDAIQLQDGDATVSAGDILYPDIAHQRFPEIPLYLQQDYPKTMYGGFQIRTNGCGITCFAMVASYLSDNEWTPPEMCERYGKYSHQNGTDGMIYNRESSAFGFYLREKTYDTNVARKALEDGYVVISIQHAGYWTRGGHYIVCESINEEGMVQVRDSNIFNYSRIPQHKSDLHKWVNVTENGSGYWIFEHKTPQIPACSRCGGPDGVTVSLLNRDYLCEKCGPAILRRTTYLDA